MEKESVQALNWDWVTDLLKRYWIDVNQKNINIFYDINNQNNEDKLLEKWLLRIWKYYRLPKNQWKRRNFYEWLDWIEIKNNKLKWKLFILDPWHGWRDPWSIVITKKTNWDTIPYKQSDINKNKQITRNWEWNLKLHTIEAKVTMDISYRLAKYIKENWWNVKITHYFQSWIDNKDLINSSNKNKVWLLDEIEKYDRWWNKNNNRFIEHQKSWLRKRVQIREEFQKWYSKKNTFFISIHADAMKKNIETGLNILYDKSSDWQKRFATKLSDKIWKIRDLETNTVSRTKNDILVLNTAKWADENNVLIELWNMNNNKTNYSLITPKWRDIYAKWIFKWLSKAALN